VTDLEDDMVFVMKRGRAGTCENGVGGVLGGGENQAHIDGEQTTKKWEADDTGTRTLHREKGSILGVNK
jgi:hypothetical protein